MKKTLAYLAAAILLGFVMARLPLAMNAPMEQDATKGEPSSVLRLYGISGQPSSLLPSSLIFFSGLIAALTVYAIFKKTNALGPFKFSEGKSSW